MDLNTFLTNFKALVDGVKLTTLAALILANLILGIAVGIKNSNFNLKELGNFLYTRVLPYVIGYFGVGVLATFDPTWSWAVIGTWGIIDLTLVGAILQNLKDLGVPIPAVLAGGKNPT